MPGLPYLVVKQNTGTNDCWGPVTAINPTSAVREVRDEFPAAARPSTEFEVYPVGVGPEGGVEKETIKGSDLS